MYHSTRVTRAPPNDTELYNWPRVLSASWRLEQQSCHPSVADTGQQCLLTSPDERVFAEPRIRRLPKLSYGSARLRDRTALSRTRVGPHPGGSELHPKMA